MPASAATIEISPPKLLTTAGVFVRGAYGLLLVIPFLVTVVAISLLKFGVLTWLIPIVVFIATAFLLPFAIGNPRVVKLVRSMNVVPDNGQDSFIVQLTGSPRIRSGIRALFEDADDFGCLSFTASGLVFQGDSVKLTVPFNQIEQVWPQNVGLRGLFVYGPRISLVVSGLPEIKSLEFAERSSWLLPTSRKTTRRLYERLLTSVATK